MKGSILCGIDLGPSGERAADVAAMLGRALDLGVCLVHAATGTPALDPRTDPAMRPAAEALAARLGARHDEAVRGLDAVRERLVRAGARVPSARVVEGRPWEVVVREAESMAAKLAVVGPHARPGTVRDRFLGSTADAVIRHAACPVVVATGATPLVGLEGRAIVVGIDGDPPSLAALRAALELAARAGAHVHAVCAANDSSIVVDALAAARALEREVKGSILWSAPVGPPAQVILDEADGCRAVLIALGTHGRKGIPRAVLGSVAEDVARRATVPVLICREPD